MIVMRMNGGLGNQLFKYSLSRYLIDEKNMCVKFDLSPYKKNYLWSFKLDKLLTAYEIATKSEINSCKYHFKEQGDFDARVFDMKPSTYVEGVFASEKYFLNMEEQLQSELVISPSILKNNDIDLIKTMNDSQSVCVHFRRGDYVTRKKHIVSFGTLSMDYYKKAIEEIFKKLDKPKFFVFSDDIEWVKENWPNDLDSIFVDHNQSRENFLLDDFKAFRAFRLLFKNYTPRLYSIFTKENAGLIDFELMRSCKNFINANSTFSWWAAYLSKFPQKIVVVPEYYYNKRVREDLYPEDWRRISNA